jgi:hypothetical protein
MRCLTDVEIQAVADREAADDVRQHAASCTRCGERVHARQTALTSLRQLIDVPLDIPPAVRRRVERTLADGTIHGATKLRTEAPSPVWRPAAWSAAAVAAATLIAIFVIAPAIKGPSTVSASEILAKSAKRLSQPVTTGVEFLEYELILDGVPRELMPDHVDGAYRVKQIIDHDTAGRYLVATYTSDGTLLSSVQQDPVNKRRLMTLRIDDQPYRFEFSLPEEMRLSPPEMERLHMQASVAMMQASGDQHVQVVETGNGRQYRIEVPRVSAATANTMWDLTEAQVLIDASDYHIVEFAVKGSFLRQPYSVSYRLINRSVANQATVDESAFALPADARAITIQGEGGAVPPRDALVLALRELTKARQAGR